MRELFYRKKYGHSPGKEEYRCKRMKFEKRLDDEEIKNENQNDPIANSASWIQRDAAETSIKINGVSK